MGQKLQKPTMARPTTIVSQIIPLQKQHNNHKDFKMITPSPEESIDYLTVSDPVIHADGINKYTSYRVDCRPPDTYGIPDSTHGTNNNNNNNAPQPSSSDPYEYSSVLRRYSDFLWLYERLHKERAGSIVPPLPEKQTVGKFSPEFVEERRRGEWKMCYLCWLGWFHIGEVIAQDNRWMNLE